MKKEEVRQRGTGHKLSRAQYMAQLRGGTTIGGQPVIHLGNLKHYIRNFSGSLADDLSFSRSGFTSTTVSDALGELDTNKVPNARTLSAGTGLTGGGDLSANRTLSVSFAGTGAAGTVARSDHNHDTTYLKLTGGTLSSMLTVNGEVMLNGKAMLRSGGASNNSLILAASGENVYIRPTGNTSSVGELLVTPTSVTHDGLTLATQSFTNSQMDTRALKTTTISAGTGLSGGGDLSTNRSLAINFAGTGSAVTSARSDHNHDATYVNKTGDSMNGLLTFGAGQATANSVPAVGVPTQGLAFVFDTDYFRLFGREDSSGEVNHLVVQMGDNPDDGFQIEGMDSGSSTPVTLFDLDRTNGLRVNTTLATTGAITEQGTSLVSKYAAIGRNITAGTGLTGGGNLTADRTLSVSFAGTGSASTVSRSDHTHALTNLTDVTVTSPVAGHTLRYSGSSWTNQFPTMNDNSDITLTSPASTHILQHDGTRWVNRTLATAGIAASATSISTGAGLTGGGNLTATRTLSVVFAGTGSSTSASRSDHNHDATYVNLSSGTAQTITSSLNLNGTVVVNGSLQSPIAQATINSGTTALSSYPLGLSFAGTGTATGLPSANGMLVSFYEALHRNFQLFQAKNTNNLFIRTHSDATNGWLAFNRIALDTDINDLSARISSNDTDITNLSGRISSNDTDISNLNARSISAGTGLTGGGTLAASRTLSVSFAGTGSAGTVSRSDHTHALTNLTDVSVASPVSGHTLRYNGTSWVNAFPVLNDNNDMTLASPASGHILQYSGSAWVNRTLATAGIASSAISISPGSGLTGGGDLTASRTLTVNFAGTGSATTVSRSDHTHALTNLTDVTVTSPAAGHTLRYSGSAWLNAFPTMNDNTDITLSSPASGHVLQHDGTRWVNRTLATAGIASSAISISPGAGLTGGGNLTATRTLTVNFAGTGAATTVARSDHNHDTTYLKLTGGTVSGDVAVVGKLRGNLTHGSDYFNIRSFNTADYGAGQAEIWYSNNDNRIRFASRSDADNLIRNTTISAHTAELNRITTPSGTGTLSIESTVESTGSVRVTGLTAGFSGYAFIGSADNLLLRSDGEVRAVLPTTTATYIPVRASSFPTSSSIKYKTNVVDVDTKADAEDIIQSLAIKHYNLKADIENGVTDKYKVGVIVEESNDLICDEDAVDTYTMLALQIRAYQKHVERFKAEKLEKDAKIAEQADEIATLKDQMARIMEHLQLA